MAITDLYGITDKNELERQARLKAAKEGAYQEQGDFDWGRGILGGLKAIGGAVAAPFTGGSSLAMTAGGLGDIADAAGKKKIVNNMTGESIDQATPDAMGKAASSAGEQFFKPGVSASGGATDSIMQMLLDATKRKEQGWQKS